LSCTWLTAFSAACVGWRQQQHNEIEALTAHLEELRLHGVSEGEDEPPSVAQTQPVVNALDQAKANARLLAALAGANEDIEQLRHLVTLSMAVAVTCVLVLAAAGTVVLLWLCTCPCRCGRRLATAASPPQGLDTTRLMATPPSRNGVGSSDAPSSTGSRGRRRRGGRGK